MTYADTLVSQTGIAETSLENIDLTTRAVVPSTLVPDKVQVMWDINNKDIPKDLSTAGNVTYHGLQIVGYYSGPSKPDSVSVEQIFSRHSLELLLLCMK